MALCRWRRGGHGIDAAATMGRVRSAVRALFDRLTPAALRRASTSTLAHEWPRWHDRLLVAESEQAAEVRVLGPPTAAVASREEPRFAWVAFRSARRLLLRRQPRRGHRLLPHGACSAYTAGLVGSASSLTPNGRLRGRCRHRSDTCRHPCRLSGKFRIQSPRRHVPRARASRPAPDQQRMFLPAR